MSHLTAIMHSSQLALHLIGKFVLSLSLNGPNLSIVLQRNVKNK